MWNTQETDYVIVGAGIAGLTLSLLASQHGRVILIAKGSILNSNSRLAQGGIASAVGPDDNTSLHGIDTIRAGKGLCESDTVDAFVQEAPEAIAFLEQMKVKLDRNQTGSLHLGKEGAHSRHRIVHAGGDATGRTVMDTLLEHLQENPQIELRENTYVADLLMEDSQCNGVLGMDSTGKPFCLRAKSVIIAAGGLGQIYKYTTSEIGSFGDGFALAYRAGAILRDMEFVQFHPTALRTDACPLPLVSEAVRGEGAVLVNTNGQPFMHRYHEWADLASRDIVARSIYQEMQKGEKVSLDARSIPDFAHRFPNIFETCMKNGIDPARDLIPIVPVVHYTMGGIQTDTHGSTAVPRLYAIGEAASSGFHGANRLASNSLLEGLVMAHRLNSRLELLEKLTPVSGRLGKPKFSYDDFVKINTYPDEKILNQVQELMWTHVGIVRNGTKLSHAQKQLMEWKSQLPDLPGAEQNLLTTALLVVNGALWRKESRGAHFREDYPDASATYLTHSLQGGTYESVAYTPVFAASIN